MKHRLNLDIKDPNYSLLKEIFKIMDCRESSEILASYGFKNINKQVFTFKIIFISMFFGFDIPFILNELESKENIKLGEYVTWIFEAKNKGPNIAKNVKVYIKLVDGLKFIKYNVNKGI